jgi:hypothetical protein
MVGEATMGDEGAPLVEPTAVHDIFVSGMARVDNVGPDFYRLTFYADSVNTFDGRPERTVVARFVIADGTIRRCIKYVLAQLARRMLRPANG